MKQPWTPDAMMLMCTPFNVTFWAADADDAHVHGVE